MKLSIKWKIFIYMLGFTAVLLGLLWLFQTVYLDEFYKKIKTDELEDACESVIEVIDDENNSTVETTKAIEAIGASFDICIRVVNTYGTDIYATEQNMQCNVHKLRRDQLLGLIAEAKLNGGSYRARLENKKHDFFMTDDKGVTNMENILGKDKYENMPKMSDAESIIAVDVVKDATGRELVIMINTIITPVDATVHTLRIQLIYISIIMVILSLVIAIVISLKISKPIIKMNDSAKKLGKGEYDVHFEGDGYKEIAQLSETLNQAAVELSKAEGLQRELVANVSHDLRTPLTMITAYSEVMRDLPGENTPENVQVIIDEAKRLTTLVNDLLDLSSMEVGKFKLTIMEVDLHELIRRCLLNIESKVKAKNIRVNAMFKREHLYVYADSDRIIQVITNLLDNAIKYGGENGTINISTKIKGTKVYTSFHNDGPQMTEDELVHIWDRFYKTDKSRTNKESTGLGLPIVRLILTQHKEDIWAKNAKEGVIFTFTLTKV